VFVLSQNNIRKSRFRTIAVGWDAGEKNFSGFLIQILLFFFEYYLKNCYKFVLLFIKEDHGNSIAKHLPECTAIGSRVYYDIGSQNGVENRNQIRFA